MTRDAAGMQRLFRQFSTPGGIPSHVSVTTPGSIHEGGELGYVLVHAFGAVMDNPDLIAVAVVGDGEAETGPLEGSWKGISFLNPARDGAVLPVLHLNDAKISGPTVLGRKDPAEVRALFTGHGYDVIEVEGSDLPGMHHRFAAALAECWSRIRRDPGAAHERGTGTATRPRWPMIVLRTPEGLDRPARGRRRAGRGDLPRPPGAAVRRTREPRAPGACSRSGCGPTAPRSSSTTHGRARPPTRSNPAGDLRMSASPHANGGAASPCRWSCATSGSTPWTCRAPGTVQLESTRRLGRMLRDVYVDNPDDVPAVLPRRDQEQPAGRRPRRSPTAPSWSRLRPGDEQAVARRAG